MTPIDAIVDAARRLGAGWSHVCTDRDYTTVDLGFRTAEALYQATLDLGMDVPRYERPACLESVRRGGGVTVRLYMNLNEGKEAA